MSIGSFIQQLLTLGICTSFDEMIGRAIQNPLLGVFLSKAFRLGHTAVRFSENALIPDPQSVFSDDGLTVLDPQTVASLRSAIYEELHHRRYTSLIEGLDWIALPVAHETDRKLAFEVQRLSSAAPAFPFSIGITDPSVNHGQKTAIEGALKNALCLITGGPGTGKTYTAGRYIATLARGTHSTLHVALLAPTGRAVQTLRGSLHRALGDTTNVHIHAQTIHGSLATKASFMPYHVVIVDESSMIDSSLMRKLLERIHSGTRVVMLGDPDQLPSIDPGQPFFDFVQTSRIPTYTLNECHRTASNRLLNLAQAIRLGDTTALSDLLHDTSDPTIQFFNCTTPESWLIATTKIQEMVIQPWSQTLTLASAKELQRQTTLLTPTRKGPMGADTINALGRRTHHPFFPVVCTQNTHQLRIMNGDLGIHQFFPTMDQIHFQQGTIPAILCPRSEPAFAMTVHKSQGSEFQRVIIVIPQGSSIDRRLLYTAVTRAKNQIVLIGGSTDLCDAVSRCEDRISTFKNHYEAL